MAKIISKLNLNKTPQLVENNSLVFAKNIRLLKDASIGPDNAIKKIYSIESAYMQRGIVGKIVGVNNKIYYFVDSAPQYEVDITVTFPPVFKPFGYKYGVAISVDGVETISTCDTDIDEQQFFENSLKNIGLTILSSELNLTTYTAKIQTNSKVDISIGWKVLEPIQSSLPGFIIHGLNLPVNILEYDEQTELTRELKTGWKYSGGDITGLVTVNGTNEEILTICEYNVPNKNIPIKHINLNKCSETDDESIYTQAPAVPLTNLSLIDTYTKTIPNGTYQFFIRYKIRDNFYTGWFPCSKECFSGNSKITNTVQGQIKHTNIRTDSDKSFIFNVEHLFDGSNNTTDYTKLFENYQIGFILANDDAVVARSWKSFNFNIKNIYFDYDKTSIKEINIDDLLSTQYNIYNVKNIAYFKNKLYITNYKETNFNPKLQEYAKNIKIELKQQSIDTDDSYKVGGLPLGTSEKYGTDVYTTWGGQPISALLNAKSYRNSNYNTYKTVTKKVKSDDNPLYTLRMLWDMDVDPDLAWINYAYQNTQRNARSLPTFDYRDNTFINCGHGYVKVIFDVYKFWTIKDNGTHPIYNNPNFTFWGYYKTNNNKEDYLTKGKEMQLYNKAAHLEYCSHVLSQQTLNAAHSVYPKVTVPYIYVIYNNKKYFFAGTIENNIKECPESSRNFGGLEFAYDNNWQSDETIKSQIEKYILDSIIGIDSEGNAVAKINGEIIKFDKYFFAISRYNYWVDIEGGSKDEHIWWLDYKVNNDKETYVIEAACNIRKETIENVTHKEFEYRSLMPFTDYEFYIHYVDKSGINTNGYLIDTKKQNNYNPLIGASIIYPRFSNIKIPDGYVSYFISINKIGSDICQLFNHDINDDDVHSADCLELDTLLYNAFSNLEIIKENGQTLITSESGKANYRDSNTTTPIEDFGTAGFVDWAGTSSDRAITVYTGISEYIQEYDITSKTIYYINIKVNGTDNWKEFNNKSTIQDFIDWSSSIVKLYEDKGVHFNIIPEYDGDVITKITLIGSTDFGFNVNMGMQLGDNVTYVCNHITIHNSSSKSAPYKDYKGYFIRINNNSKSEDDISKQLIKLTPYLVNESYDDYINLNMPGYLNKVYKPNRTVADKLYVSGSDIYDKKTKNNYIELVNHKDYIPLQTSTPSFILSNFNLNYCSTTEDLNTSIRRWSTTGDETNKVTQTLVAIQSLTSSYILELKPMYRDYVRKNYYCYNNINIDTFDSTVRSSDVNSDEAYKSIYTFNAEDYYNVPTNKGKIINMFNIVNNIYLHTEHSLFKFTGQNSLTSESGDIKLNESDPFDTGISEVFDSQYGYAGIQKKEHSLITFNSYIFYDKIANTIYAYGGEAQIAPISDSIQKILDYVNIDDILFVEDARNDRFFINIISGNKNICLSYNIKAKSFVSIHDFNFDQAFSSRNNTYFINIKNKVLNIYKFDYNNVNDYSTLYSKSIISINDMIYPQNDDEEYEVENAIDIICNDDYELIKNLNYINWICSAIKDYNTTNNMAEEDLDYYYAGNKIKIYTDQCDTGLIELTDKNGQPYIQNNKSITDPNSYKYPRYNCGIWSLNYFRDIKNFIDKFNYGTANDKSLLYGKYFIVRFIFKNKNFKLENINFNLNNYEKV